MRGANMSTAKFQEALEAHIAKLRAESIEICGEKYASYSQTEVWSPEKSDAMGCGKQVTLSFDGGGSDMLSLNGELASYGDYSVREGVHALAAKHGFHTEDPNSWSMAFYKE
jgi:hypothetical protein